MHRCLYILEFQDFAVPGGLVVVKSTLNELEDMKLTLRSQWTEMQPNSLTSSSFCLSSEKIFQQDVSSSADVAAIFWSMRSITATFSWATLSSKGLKFSILAIRSSVMIWIHLKQYVSISSFSAGLATSTVSFSSSLNITASSSFDCNQNPTPSQWRTHGVACTLDRRFYDGPIIFIIEKSLMKTKLGTLGNFPPAETCGESGQWNFG